MQFNPFLPCLVWAWPRVHQMSAMTSSAERRQGCSSDGSSEPSLMSISQKHSLLQDFQARFQEKVSHRVNKIWQQALGKDHWGLLAWLEGDRIQADFLVNWSRADPKGLWQTQERCLALHGGTGKTPHNKICLIKDILKAAKVSFMCPELWKQLEGGGVFLG